MTEYVTVEQASDLAFEIQGIYQGGRPDGESYEHDVLLQLYTFVMGNLDWRDRLTAAEDLVSAATDLRDRAANEYQEYLRQGEGKEVWDRRR